MAPEVSTAQHSGVEMVRTGSDARGQAGRRRVSSELVWAEIAKASFAIVSYVTPGGDPRSSGIVYATEGRHVYLAVAPDSPELYNSRMDRESAGRRPSSQGGQ